MLRLRLGIVLSLGVILGLGLEVVGFNVFFN